MKYWKPEMLIVKRFYSNKCERRRFANCSLKCREKVLINNILKPHLKLERKALILLMNHFNWQLTY